MVLLGESKLCKLLLVQGIITITLTMLSEAGSDSALHSAVVKEGRFIVERLDHFEELPMSC